jgi:putative transposase
MGKKRPHPTKPGVLHFVTTVTLRRIPLFKSQTLCRCFCDALTEVRGQREFRLVAFVLLPDHVHILVNPKDGNISTLIGQIKAKAAERVVAALQAGGHTRMLAQLAAERQDAHRSQHHAVWQESFRQLEVWSEWMIRQKINYIHANPVKHRVVARTVDYLWSSYHSFYRLGGAVIEVDREWWWEGVERIMQKGEGEKR